MNEDKRTSLTCNGFGASQSADKLESGSRSARDRRTQSDTRFCAELGDKDEAR